MLCWCAEETQRLIGRVRTCTANRKPDMNQKSLPLGRGVHVSVEGVCVGEWVEGVEGVF
jgi:hypothetical protein